MHLFQISVRNTARHHTCALPAFFGRLEFCTQFWRNEKLVRHRGRTAFLQQANFSLGKEESGRWLQDVEHKIKFERPNLKEDMQTTRMNKNEPSSSEIWNKILQLEWLQKHTNRNCLGSRGLTFKLNTKRLPRHNVPHTSVSLVTRGSLADPAPDIVSM